MAIAAGLVQSRWIEVPADGVDVGVDVGVEVAVIVVLVAKGVV